MKFKYHLYADTALVFATNSLQQVLNEGDKLSAIHPKLYIIYHSTKSKFNHFRSTACSKTLTQQQSS